jgi:hypothetical protein
MSGPPGSYGTPTSAPSGNYGPPTSGPPAPPTGVYGSPASAPPEPGHAPPTGVYGSPASAPPGSGHAPPTGLYGAAPATGLYGGPPGSGDPHVYGQPPQFSDLVTHPGQESPPNVSLGPLPGSDEPPPRKSKKALVVSLVIVAVVFLLAVAGTGVVVALNNAGGGTFAVNSCVRRDGEKAVKASCSDSGAYTVVSKQAKQEDCPDPNQPFIVLQHKGSDDQVLCLRPANQK